MKTLGFFFFLSSAFAGFSPEWIDAPAHAPNIRVLIHRGQKDSTLTVQAPASDDVRVQNLFKSFQPAEKITDLLPSECFELKRSDLVSRQTWCRTPAGNFRTFIELGPQKMREGERLELLLKTLGEAK